MAVSEVKCLPAVALVFRFEAQVNANSVGLLPILQNNFELQMKNF